MPKHSLESGLKRAWNDTNRFRESSKFFWSAEVLGGFVFGLIGAILIPSKASNVVVFIYPAVGLIIGLVATFSIILVINFFRAPYLQRNELRSRIESIASTHPSVRILPKKELNNYVLAIENAGAPATFRAQFRIINGESFVNNGLVDYWGFWEQSQNIESKILKGQSDKIVVAKLEVQHPFRAMELHLYHFDPKEHQRKYSRSTTWIDTTEGVVKPEFEIEVIISSDPSLASGVVNKRFYLDLGTFRELENTSNS